MPHITEATNGTITTLTIQPTWRAMDSAPKDETAILGKRSDGYVSIFAWQNHGDGFIWSMRDSCCGYYESNELVGWLPLPE